jgi:hypothetical protein
MRERKLCSRLTIRYRKISRDAYAADYVGSTRKFLFMPLPSLRLELDLTLLLLGLAVKRGLFTPDYVLYTDDAFLKTIPPLTRKPYSLRLIGRAS